MKPAFFLGLMKSENLIIHKHQAKKSELLVLTFMVVYADKLT